jgi:hypothetical protein
MHGATHKEEGLCTQEAMMIEAIKQKLSPEDAEASLGTDVFETLNDVTVPLEDRINNFVEGKQLTLTCVFSTACDGRPIFRGRLTT